MNKMDMAGMDMGLASSSMAPSMLLAMSMPTSSDMGMHMDMDMALMHMFFTSDYKGYPVVFESLAAKNRGEVFGIFLFLFVVGFLIRGLEFLRGYLEQVVWQSPTYVDCHPGKTQPATPAPASCCDAGDTSSQKFSSDDSLLVHEIEGTHASGKPSKLPMASLLFRDMIRLALCILPDLLAYALMLAVMTFNIAYFFGVVLGLGIGRFVFEKLAERRNMKPIAALRRNHCST